MDTHHNNKIRFKAFITKARKGFSRYNYQIGYRVLIFSLYIYIQVILMIVSYSVILLKFGQSGSVPPFHCPAENTTSTNMGPGEY